MKTSLIQRSVLFIGIICLAITIPQFIIAQPTAEQLSDLIAQRNSQRIANIDQISITISPESGSFFPETTSRYVKIHRGGRDVLITEDADMDVGVLSGSFDDQLPKIIQAAHTISEVTLKGVSVYRVEVDDTDALNELGRDDSDIDFYDEDDITVVGASVWIHKTELYPVRMEMEQISPEGFIVNVTLDMEDYRDYSGLAIPHRITMKIDGFQDQFTDEDRIMMREYLQDIEEQLSELSESQRHVMEEQLRPQLEQFQAMLDGEFELNEMVFVVTDVKVNQ
ncbi:MAG: hypothetical protein EA359_04995 [Balneolaceae bacterium]|nr:MAG: hypothetical protein EA359_04995 [Balneolaceae bacterium]